jgi:cyanophycinase
LCDTLAGSLSWDAMRAARAAGAVLGGSSAGAMVLGAHFFDPESKSISAGLGLVSGLFFLPHHNAFGAKWARFLPGIPAGARLLGVDEQTGILDDGPEGAWTVYGKGAATVYTAGKGVRFTNGAKFSF